MIDDRERLRPRRRLDAGPPERLGGARRRGSRDRDRRDDLGRLVVPDAFLDADPALLERGAQSLGGSDDRDRGGDRVGRVAEQHEGRHGRLPIAGSASGLVGALHVGVPVAHRDLGGHADGPPGRIER